MNALKKLSHGLQQKYRGKVPFPVLDLARDLGLDVYLTDDLRYQESGLIKRKDDKYLIYVNAKHSPMRQRVTIAHEIGHFLLHGYNEQKKIDELKNIESQVPTMNRNGSINEKEVEANSFAADLLMPKDAFYYAWGKYGTLDDLAKYFAVSRESVAVRANNLLT